MTNPLVHVESPPRPAAATAPIQPPYPKDLAASAMVLGFASVAWLSWGASSAPEPIAIGMGLAILPAIAVGVWAIITRRRAPEPTLHSGAVMRSWRFWFIAEFVAIALGNTVLGLTGHYEYAICWTYLVMALHFIPLARAYQIPTLATLGIVGVAIAVVAAFAQAVGGVPAGPVVGGIGVLAMLGTSVVMLVRARSITRKGRN